MMRHLTLALVLLVGMGQPAAAQFSIFDLKNSLVQFALSQISSPDFTITAEGVEEPEDGSTSLVGVRIADSQGVWFEADSLSLRWNARRILSGEIEINRLAGQGIRVLRAPAPTETEIRDDAAIAQDDGEPFDWPRAPLTTRIDEIAVTDVQIAPGVIGRQGLAFDATGSARDEGDIQSVRLDLRRTDAVQGRIDLAYTRSFSANTLELTLGASEAAGGLVAELAGFPEDSASSVSITATGPLTDWRLDLEAEAQQVFATRGGARVDLTGPLAVTADLEVVPGPAIGAEAEAVLAPRAQLALTVREDAGGVIRIERGSLTSPALTLSADGSFTRATGALDLTVTLDGRAALAGLVPGVEFNGFGFEGDVGGTLSALTARGAARLDGLKTASVDVGRARLDTGVTVNGQVIDLDLRGRVEGLRLDRLQPETLGPADLTLQGQWDGGPQVMTLDRLSLASRLLVIDTSGRVEVAADTATLRYRLGAPELAPMAAAYEVEAAGALDMQGDLSGALSAPRLAGKLTLDGLEIEGTPHGSIALSHDAVLGAEPEGTMDLRAEGSPRFGTATASGRFRLGAEVLSLTDLRARALGVAIDGRIDHRLAEGLTRGLVLIEAPDLAPLGRALDRPLAGSVSGRLVPGIEAGRQTLDLALDLNDLSAEGATLAHLALEGRVLDLMGAPAADLRIAAEGLSHPQGRLASLSGRVEGSDLTGTPKLTVDLEATGAEGAGATAARLTLAARTDNAETLAGLTARLTADDLAAAGARIGRAEIDLTGQDLLSDSPGANVTAALQRLSASGFSTPRLDVDASLTPRAGSGADLSARLRSGRLTGEGVAAGGVTVTADLTDVLDGIATVAARVEARALAAGGLDLPRLLVTARGPLSALDTRVETAGTGPEDRPVALRMAARIDAAAAELSARISELTANLGEDAIALEQPLNIATAGGGVRFSGLALRLPGGRLTAEGRASAAAIAARLRLTISDMAPLARIADLPLREGQVRLDADLDTGAGRGDLALSATGLRFDDTLADVGALGLTAEGRWQGGRAEVTASLSGPFERPLQARAAVPLRAGGPLPRLVPGGSLEGAVTWVGRLGDLWALVPAPDHVLDGDLDLDLRLAGTVADPQFGGKVQLSDGRYENLELGTILTDLTVRSTIEGGGTMTLDATARDAAEGQVEAKIRLTPDGLDARATSAGAVLVRRDDATASVSLDVTAKGPLTALDIGGTITVDRAEIRLVNTTPPSVVTLGDVRIKGAPRPEPASGGGSTVRLDLGIKAPRNIFVRGRGLDSEWMIDLRLTGTAARPIVRGAIERIRGQLDLIGTRFDLERGRIGFSGGAQIDPTIDVRLAAENDDLTGYINVTGNASNPQIGFTSRPGLPEEEVLPRTLFGKSRQSLTPGQAISLAAGIATLLDGSGGTVDRVRGAIGLDQLGIDAGSGGATVTVGKNLGENVFVGARQATDGSESAVTVEIEVFDNVTVEGEVGRGGDSAVGIKWKKDF